MTGDDRRAWWAEVGSLHDRFAVEVGPTVDDPGAGWHRCRTVVDDGERVHALVRAHGAWRGTDEPAVAASLFLSGYASWVAAAVVPLWSHLGVVVVPDATQLAIRVEDGHITRVRVAPDVVVDAGPDPVGRLAEVLVTDHLLAVATRLGRPHRVGSRLLRGDVAAAVAGTLSLLSRSGGDGERCAAHTDALLRAAGLSGLGACELVLAPDGGTSACFFGRATCCLWYRTGDGATCANCSLRTPDQRRARWEELLA